MDQLDAKMRDRQGNLEADDLINDDDDDDDDSSSSNSEEKSESAPRQPPHESTKVRFADEVNVKGAKKKERADMAVAQQQLDSIVKSFDAFFEQTSSHKGAVFPGQNDIDDDGDEPAIGFNPDGFMAALKQFGISAAEFNGNNTESDDNDDDDGDSRSESEEDEEARVEWEAYEAQMQAELGRSSVLSGYEKKSAPQDETTTSEDADVDIDLNLVTNFLQSYASQEVSRYDMIG